jgi:uncharacterized membrane protein YedE/YeeE
MNRTSGAEMGVLIVSCILAAILGFAAQRASICNVKAVAEVMTSRTGYMFACIFKSVLWVLVLTVPFLMLMPTAGSRLTGWQLSIGTLLGGFVFGLGAAMNGACAFSTLARLADGQLAMLGTLAGFVLGILACLSLVGSGWLPAPSPSPSMVGPLIAFAIVINLLLIAWVCYEGIRLWRTRWPQSRIVDLLLAGQYRLSTAAMLIGLANGGLYLIHGAWGYTETLHQTTEAAVFGGDFPSPQRWLLFAAMPLGMVLSTWQRGSLRVDWRPQFGWIRNIVGGILMGLGAALIPGGNDALVLYAIPSLSPQAIPSYLAMTLGIASALMAMRFVLGIETRVECRGDICIAEAAPRPSAFPQSARLTS